MSLGRTLRSLEGIGPARLTWRLVRQGVLARVAAPIAKLPVARSRRRDTYQAGLPHADSRFADRFIELEQQRYLARRDFLSPALSQFEETYGLLVGSDLQQELSRARSPVAFHPYCASVRARQLSVLLASRDDADAFDALVCAARAIALQLEFDTGANHFLENAIGLFCAATVSLGPESRVWETLAVAIFERELPKQFGPDGAHYEGSVTYHLHLLSGLLCCHWLARWAGVTLPSSVESLLPRALGFLRLIEAPDGTYPLFNDASLDGSLSIASVKELASLAGITHAPAERLTDGLVLLEGLGWTLARNRSAFLAFDTGVDGAREQPGHVHADALTLELWVKGRRAIVDHGVESYERGSERERTRSSAVHNVVTFGDEDSSETWAGFRTGRFSNTQLVSQSYANETAVVVAEHHGYRHLKGSPKVTRKVALSIDALEITDSWESSPLPVMSRMHVAQDAPVTFPSALRTTPSTWYPFFGKKEPALRLEQTAVESPQPASLHWRFEW